MVPVQMIIGEVLTVLNYGIWLLGLVAFIGLVVALFYTLLAASFVGDWIGENRTCESSIYDREDMPATAHALYIEHLSTGDILDKCRTHREQLKQWHRTLCERSGVDPNSIGPMADLIAEAVFDGRQQYNCINAVDRATQERNCEQHA